MNILIIAAHPDDEVLGMGGTIKKLSKKNKIFLCVVTEGSTAQYTDKKMIQVRKNACIKAGKLLGISQFEFLELPDMKLDTISHLDINRMLEKIIKKFKPQVVYPTPINDLNMDHQRVYESTLVVTRPISSIVKQLFCYELPGFTRTSFNPNVYEDITKEFDYKIKAFKMYKSEIQKFPHARSLKSLENLAIQRGIESGLNKAESFQLIRSILN